MKQPGMSDAGIEFDFLQTENQLNGQSQVRWKSTTLMEAREPRKN